MTSLLSWEQIQPVLVGASGMMVRRHEERGNELWICGMQGQLPLKFLG